jgi:hypothetical protein
MRAGINIVANLVLMSIKIFSKTMDYAIFSFDEAVEYLSKNKLSIGDNDEALSIPSNYAFVYSFDNGEILVLPNELNSSAYPAILFRHKIDFVKCCKNEKFPIPDIYLTWFERNSSNVQAFTKDSDFHRKSLTTKVDIDLPFKNRDDILAAYLKICKLLKSKKLKSTELDEVVYGYTFEVIKYFIEIKDYSYEIAKRYEMYTPYYYPFLKCRGKDIDIVSLLLGSLEVKSENSFIVFYHFATAPLER